MASQPHICISKFLDRSLYRCSAVGKAPLHFFCGLAGKDFVNHTGRHHARTARCIIRISAIFGATKRGGKTVTEALRFSPRARGTDTRPAIRCSSRHVPRPSPLLRRRAVGALNIIPHENSIVLRIPGWCLRPCDRDGIHSDRRTGVPGTRRRATAGPAATC